MGEVVPEGHQVSFKATTSGEAIMASSEKANLISSDTNRMASTHKEDSAEFRGSMYPASL